VSWFLLLPPGSRTIVQSPDGSQQIKKMRARRYRGERSHGMLCSLDELGWIRGGPDEVATLCDLTPGELLDHLPANRRPEVVVGWERAKRMEKEAAREGRTTRRVPPASSILRHLNLIIGHY
jgi:hypothetical protein